MAKHNQAAHAAPELEPQDEAEPELAPVKAAPVAEKSSADRIAELEAQLARVLDLVGSKPAEATVVSAQALQDIIQPAHEITVGGTIRPERGPLHLSVGTPIFNPNRPTGRAG